MDMEEIIALVEKAKNGNQSAIAQLYEATSKAVYFTALKIVGNPSDAEDIAQDTYVAAISKLSDLKDNATFPKWIKTIAANTAKNYMTKKKPMLFNTDEDEEATLGSIPEISDEFIPDQAADRKETCRLVSEMIDSLPEKQRAALVMFYYDEMSISEIAEAMGTNDNTIKSRLNYARKYIKDEVEALAKKGTKLYGVAGIPLIAFVLRNLAADTAVPAGIAAKVTAATAATAAATTTAAATATTATATATTTAASTAATGVALGTAAKVAIAAVASVAVIGGGVAVANVVSEPAVFKAEAGTPSEFELMLEDYLFGDGELDTKYFGYVEELQIFGEFAAVNRDINERFGYGEEFSVCCYGSDWGFHAHTESSSEPEGNYPLGNLEDIEFVSEMKNLKILEICLNSVENIEPVKDLKKLEELSLWENKISDVSAVSGLNKLERLYLGDNDISDISAVENLKRLKKLNIFCNFKISDLSPLKKLTELEWLSVDNNNITDISDLKDLKNLTYLNLRANNISDVEILKSLKELGNLDISYNNISKTDVEELRAALPDCKIIADNNDYEYEDVIAEVEPVVTTTVATTTATTTTPETTPAVTTEPEVEKVEIGGKLYPIDITELDISHKGLLNDDVRNISKLKNLTYLSMGFNSINDLSFLSELTSLEQLYIERCYITDISPLANLKKLKSLSIYRNNVADISVLAELPELARLDIQYNKVRDISPLANIDGLTEIYLSRIGITDISALCSHPDLKRIILDDNEITNSYLLKDMKNLDYLQIKGTKLSKNTIADLHSSLPQCEIISDYGTFKPTEEIDGAISTTSSVPNDEAPDPTDSTAVLTSALPAVISENLN